MSVRYQVRLEGAEAVLAKVTDARLLAPPLRKTMDELSLLAQARAREGAPRDRGMLARSFLREVQPLMSRVYSLLVYAPVMERGRRPGAKMPPPSALEGWARRHGFQGSLFVLARAIARRGIKGRFFMRAARDAVQRAMPAALASLAARIERIWGAK